MADISPKVERTLARYLVVLVARIELGRETLLDVGNIECGAAFERSLNSLTAEEREELATFAAALAASLGVGSATSVQQRDA